MPGSTSPHQFPMERVLYNLHHKCCTYALQRTSRRSRSWAEHSILVTAVCSFGALLLAHMTFVHRLNAAVHNNDHPTTIPTTCLSSIPGFVKDSDLTHIILHADDSTLLSRVTASPPSRQPRRIEEKEQPEERNPTVCAEEQSEENANNEHTTCDTFPATFLGSPSSSSSAWRWEDEILFSYSLEKGYLLLSQDLCERHGINVQYVQVSKRDANCFGEPFLQWLVFSILGHDTVIINWLLGTYNHVNNGSGYIYNPRTRVMTDLSQYHHETSTTTNSKSSLAQWAILRMTEELALKTVVVIKTSFLFFILTTLVSFTLRETQGRMLDFTHHLQEYVRANRSVASLVMTHVVENLVFVPIMVGMIFFLIEFYRGDKLLAFMVLSLVWVCESFSVVSLRTKQGVHFFPRIFFLLFALFHFYHISFPWGFSYSALATSMCFMLHSMLFFWHRYELPAVVNGRVRLEHPRQGTSASSPVSARSMQEEELDSGRESSFTEQQHDHTTAPIHSPRSIFGRSHSFNTAASGRLSRTSSTGGMFHPDDDDDDGSYMYFMDGEVVMHRNQPRPSSPFSTTSESNAPNENQSSSSAMSTEPRRNSRRERFVNDLETLVASAVSTDEDSESFGRAPPANSGSTGVGIDASNTTPQPLSREQSRTESCVYQDDGNETSALQAILNVMEVEELESERGPSLDETSDPDDSPDSLLAPPSSIFR